MGASAGPSGRQDRTIAGILDAATHLLAEHGAPPSMAGVAAAAGVSRATLYRYFPARDELLAALAVRAVDDAGARLADAALDRVPVVEAIERMTRALVTVGDRYAVLAHEHVKPDADVVERRLRAPIRDVLARGTETGELRDDLPLEVLLELYSGAVQAATRLVGRGRMGLEDAAASAASLFFEGARARRRGE